MRLRKLTLAVGLAGALGANLASALGLGEIQLRSRLNQPLDAEIKLLQVRDLTPDEIRIALGSPQDFERAGIDRLFYLTGLKFTVDLNSPSGPVVRVTSDQPVREPYLNFLIDTQWPSGRVLREYTLLMDLPVFSEQSNRPVERAATSPAPQYQQPARSSQPAPASTPVARQTPPPQPRPQQPEPPQPRSPSPAQSSYSSDAYSVSANDTLWAIALKVRPDRQYSVHQTMVALQKLNPQAFINGNINLLRQGQVLRVPTGGQIEAIAYQQAVNEVALQNSQWNGNGPQLDATGRSSTAATTSEGISGRLTVASSDSSSNAQSGRASGSADVESLQGELAVSLEELDKSRRENTELKDRVTELEDQIQTMERLLEVSSQELQALQANAQKGSTATAADQPKPTAVAKSPAVDPSKVVKTVTPPPPPSLLDLLMENILYVGAGIAALLGGLFFFLKRRQEQNEEQAFAASSAAAAGGADDLADDLDVTAGLDDEQGSLFDFDTEADEISEPMQDLDEEADEHLATHSQTGDAVAEADIYIAYGKFDQAAAMLLNALAANEHDNDARLKLLEVYAETQDLNAFDQQLSVLSSYDDIEAFERGQMLREQFSDAPAFVAQSVTSSLDSDDTPLVSDSEMSDVALADSDFELDFSLDDEVAGDDLDGLSLAEDSVTFASSGSGSASSTDDDFNFEFDVSDDTDLEVSDTDLNFNFSYGESDAVADSDEPEAAEQGDTLSLDVAEEPDEDDVFTLSLSDEFTSSDDDVLSEDLDGADVADNEVSLSEALTEEGSDSALLDETVLADEDDFLSDLDTDAAIDLSSDELDLDALDKELDMLSAAVDVDDEIVSSAEVDATSPGTDDMVSEEEDTFDFADLTDIDELPSADDLDLDSDDVEAVSLAQLDADLDADLDFMEASETAEDSLFAESSFAGDDELADIGADLLVEQSESEVAVADTEEALETVDTEQDAVAFDLDAESNEFETPETSVGEDFSVVATDLADEGAELVEDLTAEVDADDELVFDTDGDALTLSDSDIDALDFDVDSDDDFSFDALSETDEPVAISEPDNLQVTESAAPEVGADDLPSPEALDDMEWEFDDLEDDVADLDAPIEDATLAVDNQSTDADVEAFDLADADEGESFELSEEDVFAEALSDVPETAVAEPAPVASADPFEDEFEEDFDSDFLADTDEAATKLDLARAYMDMGDHEGAKDILDEVVQEGTDEQRQQAEELIGRLS